MQLEWESIQQVREIVPTSQLYPRVPITLVPSTPLTNTRVLTYTYDGLQRLTETQEVGPIATTAYSSTYDLAGNRLSGWTNGILVQSHTYDAANQVSGWSYDAAGNLTSDGTTTNTWDALNRLTVQGTTSNAYNGDGVLVGQIVGSAAITYTQDLIAPLSQILSDGTSQYVYGADRLFGVAGGTRTWYLSDALGSVRQTFDDAGFVQQALRYDAWGVPQGAAIAPFGYTGELQQGNQVYLRARWYNAGNGAFGSRDPFAGMAEMPYSLHSYQYGYSNPVLNTDPTGKYSTSSIEEMIQRRYEHMYTIGIFQDEYPIYLGSKTGLGIDPATGRLGGNLSDIVNSGKLDIVDIYRGIGYAYEIKNERDQARGSLEIDRYIDIYRNLPLPKSPKSIPTPPDVLVRGSNFPSDRWENPGTNPYYFGSTIIARLGEPGVIVWRSIRNNQPIPIIVDVKVDYRIKQPRSNMQPVPAFAYNSCAILFPGIIPLNPFGGNNGGNDEDDVYNYPRENTPPFLPYKPLLPNNTPANNALF